MEPRAAIGVLSFVTFKAQVRDSIAHLTSAPSKIVLIVILTDDNVPLDFILT